MEMIKTMDQKYHDFIQDVKEEHQEIIDLLSSVNETHHLVQDLSRNYDFVIDKTRGLKQDCEDLLDEQTQLQNLGTELETQLKYFDELGPITRFLSSGGDIVTEPKFLVILEKLDQCLSFMDQHPTYQDAHMYKQRYRQCMTRSLTLIKMYFCDQIRTLQDKQLSVSYAKFRAFAMNCKYLIQEIETRCPDHVEYFNLLRDCFNAYFSARKTILLPLMIQKVKELPDQGLVHLANGAVSFIAQLFADEDALFRLLFSFGEPELQIYLEQLVHPLASRMRPLILSEQRLDALSELVQTLTIQENDHRHIRVGFSSIVEEAQSRLAFRAESIINQQIHGFKPREQELSIFIRDKQMPLPQKTQHMGVQDVLRNLESSVPEMEVPTDPFSVPKMEFGGGEWYPPCQRAVFVLEKLYRAVPDTVFQDLAQDAVHGCLESLKYAHGVLEQKTSFQDATLFSIKNLLLLREHLGMFDAEFVPKEQEMSLRMRLRQLPGMQWANGVLSILPDPFQHRPSDSKQYLDDELKRCCEDFILQSSRQCTEDLSAFVLKAGAFKQLGRTSLGSQSFAQPQIVQELQSDFVKKMQVVIPETFTKISSYIGDPSTQMVLLRIIRNHVLETYTGFYEFVSDYCQVMNPTEFAQVLDACWDKSMRQSP
ncbi:Sec34-like family-domain-containing protein [Gorgonomyces haynaldii]|nr:Sec34-like family-domain-containing protein [Gorgonomyces haynaldii]